LRYLGQTNFPYIELEDSKVQKIDSKYLKLNLNLYQIPEQLMKILTAQCKATISIRMQINIFLMLVSNLPTLVVWVLCQDPKLQAILFKARNKMHSIFQKLLEKPNIKDLLLLMNQVIYCKGRLWLVMDHLLSNRYKVERYFKSS